MLEQMEKEIDHQFLAASAELVIILLMPAAAPRICKQLRLEFASSQPARLHFHGHLLCRSEKEIPVCKLEQLSHLGSHPPLPTCSGDERWQQALDDQAEAETGIVVVDPPPNVRGAHAMTSSGSSLT